MSGMVSLTRLARLVGLQRSTLQRMAQAGELETFDGHVTIAEVLRAFPDTRFDNDSELRRVEEIKDAALVKAAEKASLPDAGVLVGRLAALGRDYATLEAENRQFKIVYGRLTSRLRGLLQDQHVDKSVGDGLLAWLAQELSLQPGDANRRRQLVSQERLMRVMSAQVSVLPRGSSFEARGNETLLEAGLRAGLSFAYGCSNGNCGECKARVVEGEVTRVRPHDFALSSAEKARGVTLMCCYAPSGDVTIEAAIAGADEIPEQSLVARVRTIEPLGPDRLAIHLLTPRSERFRFLAGQHLHATIGSDTTAAAIASCPCEERRIEVHVGLGDASECARAAMRDLKVDDEVALRGPFGAFVLDEASARPLILIADGAGYAPIKSLMQHALSLDNAPSIALYRFADGNGLYQDNLPRSYASALDNFSYVALPADNGHAGGLAAIATRPDLAASDVYCSGSAAFIAQIGSALAAAGLPAERLRFETVGPA